MTEPVRFGVVGLGAMGTRHARALARAGNGQCSLAAVACADEGNVHRADGSLGEILRIDMTCSSWTHTQAYYAASPWRGTWSGDGGGVLMNQAPGSDVLMVDGNRATAILDGGRLRLAALPISLRQHLLGCSLTGSEDGRLAAEWRDVSCEPDCADMEMAPSVVERFARHIRSGDDQVADGDDGLRQLELTNAAYLSAARRAPVALPVDAAEIVALFDTLVAVSNPDSLRRQAAAEMARLRQH